jgi:hypothetical protein
MIGRVEQFSLNDCYRERSRRESELILVVVVSGWLRGGRGGWQEAVFGADSLIRCPIRRLWLVDGFCTAIALRFML